MGQEQAVAPEILAAAPLVFGDMLFHAVEHFECPEKQGHNSLAFGAGKHRHGDRRRRITPYEVGYVVVKYIDLDAVGVVYGMLEQLEPESVARQFSAGYCIVGRRVEQPAHLQPLFNFRDYCGIEFRDEGPCQPPEPVRHMARWQVD